LTQAYQQRSKSSSGADHVLLERRRFWCLQPIPYAFVITVRLLYFCEGFTKWS